MLEVLRRPKSWATSFSSRAAPGAARFTAGLKFALVLIPEQQRYRGNCLAIVFSGGGTIGRLEMLSPGIDGIYVKGTDARNTMFYCSRAREEFGSLFKYLPRY